MLTIEIKKLDGTQKLKENVIKPWFNKTELEFLEKHKVLCETYETEPGTWIFDVYVDGIKVWHDWAHDDEYVTSYIEEEIIRRYND